MNKDPAVDTVKYIPHQSTKRPISPEQAEKITGKAKSQCTRELTDTVSTLDFPEFYPGTPRGTFNMTSLGGSSGSGLRTDGQEMGIQELIETWRSTLADHRTESKADIIAVLSEVTNGMLDRIADLEAQVSKREHEIDSLHYHIDTLDQNRRARNAKFVGVPETDEEDPKTVVIDIAKRIGITIKPSDIVECERIGKPPTGPTAKPRQIMTKFATTHTKVELFKMRKSLSTSTDADLKSTFINEDLAPYRAKLLYVARMLKNDKLINKYWVFRNEVQVKLTEFDEAQPVRSFDFFKNFHDHPVFQSILRPKFVPKQAVSAMSIFKSKPGYAQALRRLHESLGEEHFNKM
jgi:hypothetical protein